MKVIIDHDRCEGNARCVLAAPAVSALRTHAPGAMLTQRPGESCRTTVADPARRYPPPTPPATRDAPLGVA